MKIYLTIIMIFATQITIAAQSCATEEQIPSTTPDTRFNDNSDGTISDNSTNLMWQKCVIGISGLTCDTGVGTTLLWDAGLAVAASDNFAGYTDWRLPNINELHSIVERKCASPAININFFPNTPVGTSLDPSQDDYWSSTPSGQFDTHSLGVGFNVGRGGIIRRRQVDGDDKAFVRLVRDIVL